MKMDGMWSSAPICPGVFRKGTLSKAIVGCLKSRLKVAGEQIKIPSFHRKLSMSIDITGTTYA
jgi:hypothetical protein